MTLPRSLSISTREYLYPHIRPPEYYTSIRSQLDIRLFRGPLSGLDATAADHTNSGPRVHSLPSIFRNSTPSPKYPASDQAFIVFTSYGP